MRCSLCRVLGAGLSLGGHKRQRAFGAVRADKDCAAVAELAADEHPGDGRHDGLLDVAAQGARAKGWLVSGPEMS